MTWNPTLTQSNTHICLLILSSISSLGDTFCIYLLLIAPSLDLYEVVLFVRVGRTVRWRCARLGARARRGGCHRSELD